MSGPKNLRSAACPGAALRTFPRAARYTGPGGRVRDRRHVRLLSRRFRPAAARGHRRLLRHRRCGACRAPETRCRGLSVCWLVIGAMVGFCLGASARRPPVVTDGFISAAAAALAARLHPGAADYLFAAHLSVEPGHRRLLAALGQEPLLSLGMRLGEGTGAALAIQLIRAAVAAFTGMATFASAGVSGPEGGEVPA